MRRPNTAMGALCAVGLALVAAGSLISCKSVPLPNSPNESLFILPTRVVSALNNGDVRVVGVSITVHNDTTNREFVTQLPSGESFAMLSLDPGAYSIRSIRITMQHVGGRNPWSDTHDFYGSFFIEKRVVRYYERKIYVGSRPQGWYNFGWDALEVPADKQACLNQMKKDPRWQAWQDYSLVNF